MVVIPYAEFLDHDRKASILTKTQRKAITGQEVSHPDVFRNRLKDRIRNGIVDGEYLTTLSPEFQKTLMEPLNDAQDKSDLLYRQNDDYDFYELDADKLNLTRDIHTGMKHWLAFLYSATSEASPWITPIDTMDVPSESDIEWLKEEQGEEYAEMILNEFVDLEPQLHFNFESLLREAVEAVVESQGEELTQFELTIETQPKGVDDLDALHERFKRRERLTHEEMRELHAEGVISGADIQEYYEDQKQPRD